MSKEEEFTLYSNDKEKFKFIFQLKRENNGKITVKAKRENKEIFPKVYERCFGKEELIKITGVVIEDEKRIFDEVVSSFKSNTAKFTLDYMQLILSFSIFNDAVEFKLPVPLRKFSFSTEEAISKIAFGLENLNGLSDRYNILLSKLANNLSKNKLIYKPEQNLDKATFADLLRYYTNQINQKLNFIKSSICQNQNNIRFNRTPQYNDNKFENDLVNQSVDSFFFKHTNLQLIKTFKSVYEGIFPCCFLKDGRLVSSTYDNDKEGKIVIHDKYTYESDFIIEDEDFISSVCGLRNGNLASVGGNLTGGLIKIWEIDKYKYKLIHTIKINFEENEKLYKVIELEDGKLCSCSQDEVIRILDNKDDYKCIQALDIPEGRGHHVLEINDFIISVSGSVNSFRIWDKSTYKCISDNNDNIKNICCESWNALAKLKEKTIILGANGEIFVVNVLSLESKSFKNDQLYYIMSICVYTEDRVLIGNNKGMIILFDLPSHQIIYNQKFHDDPVFCIIKGEDNKIFSSSAYSFVNVYNYCSS